MTSSDKTQVYVYPLTHNVTSEHLTEIFGHFGKVVNVELESQEQAGGVAYNKGIVSFTSSEDASASVVHLNKGEIDGVEVTVSLT